MDYIEIAGYKSIKSAKIDLAPINILIGANGSGKSNFLSFFEFLQNIYKKNLKEYVALRGGTDKFLFKGDKFTTEINCKLSFKNTNAYSFTIKKGEDAFVFTKEELWYHNTRLNDISTVTMRPNDISNYRTESNMDSLTAERSIYIRGYLKNVLKYHFHDTGSNSPFNKESNIETDKFFLYDKGQNIAAFLFNIYDTNKIRYNFIVKTIQSIAPYFLDFVFNPNENGLIKLFWQSKHTATIYGINDLSDGTLRFIAMTVLFLQPNPPETIIIDEPELGLHPSAISKLSGLIKSVAAKDCQVIVATQSTDLISHFKPEDIITVDQINGESIFKRLSNDELHLWLEDYTIDDLWKRSIITTGQLNY